MATLMIIWGVAIVAYCLFWAWYVGFGSKVSEQDLNRYMACVEQTELSEESMASFRNFFANDDGKEFFMVNLLLLKEPKSKSRQLLNKYTSIFVGKLIKRAGHPYFVGLAQARNIENLNCEVVDGWTTTALMRYRSRKDLGELLVDTFRSEHHGFKLAALEKTFAFPASAILNIGSVRSLVGLVIALIAAVTHIVLVN